MNIYVGNLPFDTSEDELKSLFEQFGEVASVNIIKDQYSGKSKGFGFVEMPEQADGESAIQQLDGSELSGRNIKVNQARPRGERPNRSRRY
jgi:RNA recognition motif-containing protein